MGPDSVHSWMVIAHIFDGLERRWEATIALRIATCIDRDNARTWYELSEAVQSEHFHQEALNRAIVLGRGDPDILCASAISFYESGMKKEALDTLEEVLAIDPEHADAQVWADRIEEEFEELEEMGECPRLGEYGSSVDYDDYPDDDDW